MLLTASQWNLRLENEYNAMCAFPICDLFSWKIAPGQTTPRVRSYIITYYVKTMVKPGTHIKDQVRTVVRIDLPEDPNSAPLTRIIEGDIPYHPNWYRNGNLCNGDMWAKDPILWRYVINIGRVLAFDPGVTNPKSAANSDAAAYWEKKNNGLRKPRPYGRTDFPHPRGY